MGRPIRRLPEDFKKYYSKWKDKEVTETIVLLSLDFEYIYNRLDNYKIKIDIDNINNLLIYLKIIEYI